MILFKIDKNSPIFEELKSIFSQNGKFRKLHQKKIMKVREIKHALTHDSFAKGDGK